MRAEWSFVLDGLEKTVSLGRAIARGIVSPGVAAFFGGLGTGKTTFIQALGSGLGVEVPITSPTYTIINHYPGGRLPLFHVDCFRIKSEDELREIGLEELFSGSGVVCVEWPEKAINLFPRERCEIYLSNLGRERRGIKLLLSGDLWPGMEKTVARWMERNL